MVKQFTKNSRTVPTGGSTQSRPSAGNSRHPQKSIGSQTWFKRMDATVNTFQFNLICFYGTLKSRLASLPTAIAFNIESFPNSLFHPLGSTCINSVSSMRFHQEMPFIVLFDFALQGFAYETTAAWDKTKPFMYDEHSRYFLLFFGRRGRWKGIANKELNFRVFILDIQS